MKLELEDIKKMHEKAYNKNSFSRSRAASDAVFYHVTQWEDDFLNDTQLAYKGEFNILRKAGRQILADLARNPVSVDFEPQDEKSDAASEILDGMYRKSANNNASLEAYSNAEQDMIVCGFGAWKLYTKYITNKSGDRRQTICRKPIFEANNVVLWDPDAKLLDKSDAKYVSLLKAYSYDAYKDMVSEITGQDPEDIHPHNFAMPENGNDFAWISGADEVVYVSEFYHRQKTTDEIITFEDLFGETIEMYKSEIKDVMDELIDSGHKILSSKEIDRWEVTKYIVSGMEILKQEVIAGEHIPIIPVYGERAIVKGEEYWEGITRLAKDPQRLRNFQLSYLADIVSRSPRVKPIFMQEQIAGFEDMYSETGSENNYPYLIQNRVGFDGRDLPMGPVGLMPEQTMPSALIASIDLSRQAVEDVANPGVPQNIADPDLSGKAVLALQSRVDMQSVVYQEHMKHAKRRDAEVFASMASVVYDTPRTIKIQLPDGTTKDAELMQNVIDKETGEIVTLNDLRNTSFDVSTKIGPAYASQKEATIDRIAMLMQTTPPNDPIYKALQLKLLTLMDSVDFDDIKDYANKQLVLTGFRKPQTPEEMQMLQVSQQQGQQPDANMMLAMAENKKGDAALLKEKRQGIEMQMKAQTDQAQTQIKAFDAQTKRMDTEIKAQQAQADINNTDIDSFGKKLDNTQKMTNIPMIQQTIESEILQPMAG